MLIAPFNDIETTGRIIEKCGPTVMVLQHDGGFHVHGGVVVDSAGKDAMLMTMPMTMTMTTTMMMMMIMITMTMTMMLSCCDRRHKDQLGAVICEAVQVQPPLLPAPIPARPYPCCPPL